MGVIDEINKHVFPNVASRPNYVIGDPRCSLWTPQGTAILEMPVKGTELISALADPILQQLEEEEVQQNIKFSFIGGRCSIHIGPVVLNKEKEIDRIRKREISSLYLRNALVEAPGLGVKLVGQHQLSYRKLRLLAIESIFQGLTMLYECQNSEVFRTLNGRRLVEGLFRETAAVTTAFFPTLNYNTLLHSMQIHIMNRSNHVSELIAIPTRGLLTPVDYKNGVIVKHAKELGFRCPLHGRVTEMVKRKTVEAKLYFADEKLRKNQEAYKQRRTFYQEERKEEKLERQERWEKIREKRAESRTQKRGQQFTKTMPEMPAWDKPKIMSLGNLSLGSRAASNPTVSHQWPSVVCHITMASHCEVSFSPDSDFVCSGCHLNLAVTSF